MTDRGLLEVENPSEMLLAGRPRNISGNCAVCTLEGTRPLIAEIQALVTQTSFPAPRRTTNGIDYNRMCLIIAVLEKRLGLKFYQNDVYLNVIGGLHLDEPASDLSVALALISSVTDRVIPDDLIALGEVGLAGECRAVANLEVRVREAARLPASASSRSGEFTRRWDFCASGRNNAGDEPVAFRLDVYEKVKQTTADC